MIFDGAPGTGSRSGPSYAFTSLTPICKGLADNLGAHLRSLPVAEASPLAKLAYVHLGRWLVIDGLKMSWAGSPRRPTRLRSDYLLFTASITGPEDTKYTDELPHSFLVEMAEQIPDAVDAIWGSCVGYPGSTSVVAFAEYLRRSQLDTELFYIGYPNTTVGQVDHALGARDHLVDFVRSHQAETDPALLQQAYLEESKTWSL